MSGNIESVLHENRVFKPSAEFRQQANIKSMDEYKALCQEAEDDYQGFWGKLAKERLSWSKPFTQVLDDSKAPFFKWFADGELNASYNCLDRHLADKGDKVAIIFEKDDGSHEKITYKELHQQVCQFANTLKQQGVQKGDRVVIYLPMITQAVVAMQACARIGAIHSVVFAGFSASALRDRINDTQARLIITANEGVRGGKVTALKATVDKTLAEGCDSVETVIVYQRTESACELQEGRDIWWHDAIDGISSECEPEPMNAEDPLFILYTSGSTGKPKGVQHSTAGYLLGAVNSMDWVMDYKDEDVFWCTADIGWITGHTYITYGPLGIGATQILFEGVPTYPDASRFWQTIEKHKVTVFYTAPTAIRSLIKSGADLPNKFDLSSLRLLGTVGEPINPEAWIWYYEVVGKSKCPIIDTWWQTETGSNVIAPMPGAFDLKPGSCTLPLPGMIADIVDESGNSVDNGQGGFLVIKKPFPSLLRTVWGDDQRFVNTYFPPEFDHKFYLAGDSAHRDQDGYFWIMGRIDDVLNVSGHRLGTMEIESSLAAHELVAEAAVVGKPDDIKGESVVAFVILKGDRPEGEEALQVAKQLQEWVGNDIGKIARPDDIRFGDNLPKTRSGKIMRRLLRSLARGEEITQDTSTLENPQVMEQLSQSANK
ncbi:acetate--CoA ligase [Brackiella oedipodis]|uniref:acetate--CoA ligase n=1 Tax=Brackiella oedipodis TaxID=124225 RepID=UPI00048DE4EC|nr:acetate--CoA ligase [Brackiella oedipodis]